MSDRQTIRSSMLKQRRELSVSVQQAAADQLANLVQNKDWFQKAQHIAFYSAVRGELNPSALLTKAWDLGKTCYLPVLTPDQERLSFLPYFPEESLTINQYGISEPLLSNHAPCQLDTLDIVFTPLVAFDDAGNRLGFGKGYYDKTFADVPSALQMVGLAYDFQHVPKLPVESWDVPLDRVLVFDMLENHFSEREVSRDY